MGGLFAPKAAAAPPPPKPMAPAVLPDPENAEAMEAKRRAELDAMKRAGSRSSTILTGAADRGNSAEYSGSKLG